MDQTQQNAPVAPAPQVQSQPVQQQPVAQPAPVAQVAPVQDFQQPVAQPQIVTDNSRTRQEFEKLLERNNELARSNAVLQQEMQRRAQVNQQYAPLQAQPQAPQAQVDPRDFVEVDSNGVEYINEQKLKSKIDEVNQRAMRSEQLVQNYIQTSEQREQERQNRETFSAYPELNPDPTNDKFDRGFHNRTRQVMIDALVNPQEYGGRALSFKEAADFVKRDYSPASPVTSMDAQNDAAQAAADSAAVKQQAAAAIVSQPQPARASEDDEALNRRLASATRIGDDEALAIRLKFTDHKRTASDDEA